ncbi:hypothetical protein [Cytophaga sp.]|uniref:hypothetical protein n=1 Tax=Cytophaga sp. TaxID=29535 RepID=UPI003F7D1580
MKPVLFLLCILCNMGLTYAQNVNEFTLEIKNIAINDCGKELTKDTIISKKIYLDQGIQILLYDNTTYRYYTFIRMERSANRVKMIEQNYVTDRSGKIIVSGKRRKHVQYINVSMPGKFANTTGEYLLIDEMKYISMRATFFRTLYYGLNQPN